MLKIKVCGMTDPANTHEIAALPVDFLGFIFYRYSKRFVGDSPDENLFHGIPVNIMKTGVFVDDEPSAIIKCARKYCLDFIQLHGNESPRVCSALRKDEVKIIKAFRISPDFDFIALNKYMEVCDYFLFDTGTGNSGGSGKKFDWSVLDRYYLNKPFILSGGIGPDDSEEIRKLNHRHLFAADINSRFEIRPGLKDLNRIKAFIYDIKS